MPSFFAQVLVTLTIPQSPEKPNAFEKVCALLFFAGVDKERRGGCLGIETQVAKQRQRHDNFDNPAETPFSHLSPLLVV